MKSLKKNKQRVFNVDFFSICELKSNQQQLISMPISMKYFLGYVLNTEIRRRFMNINGENIRLQKVRKIEKSELDEFNYLSNSNNLWELMFIRFKDSEVFGLADENGDYDEEELDKILISRQSSGKHLASPTPCIYDEDKNIIIIPRNKEGVSSSTILEFMRRVCKKEDLDFGSFSFKQSINFNEEMTFKNIDISIGNLTLMSDTTEKELNKKAPSVFGCIQAAKNMGGDTANINVTMGDKRNLSLSLQTAKDMLALARSGCDNINKLRIGVRTSSNKRITKFDLLHDKISDKFTVYYNADNRIKSNTILLKLLYSYNSKYAHINQC